MFFIIITNACVIILWKHSHLPTHLFFCFYYFSCSLVLPVTLVVLLSYVNICTSFLKCSAKWTQPSLFWCWSRSYHKKSAWFKSSLWLQIFGSLFAWSIWGIFPLLLIVHALTVIVVIYMCFILCYIWLWLMNNFLISIEN